MIENERGRHMRKEKYITNCIEFNPNATSSVAEELYANEEKGNRAIILNYLRGEHYVGIGYAKVRDRITGKYQPGVMRIYTDGEYKWTEEEIYHFETYDIPLNKDFVKKVLIWSGGRIVLGKKAV